jgi:hypothetical protein
MWYKLAVSKEDAERIIKEDLASGNYDVEASSDLGFVRRKLIQKYGEDYSQAINDQIKKLISDLSASSPWEKGSDETNLHGQASGINAFYIMPDGTLTPNLGSHVSFDKILFHRIGIDPKDRHMFPDLTNAVRVNIIGNSKVATIYSPLTKEQQAKIEDMNIENLNHINSEKPSARENNNLIESLEMIGYELSNVRSNLEDILRAYVDTKVNPNFSAGNYKEPYSINTNLKNIDEDLFKKLSSIKDDFTYLDSIADILKGIRS